MTTKKSTTAGPVSQTPETAIAQPANDLNIADLKNLSMIIDIASSRGAFRANEMATIGLVYNKLSAFLAKIAPAPTVGQDGAKLASTPTETENK